MKQIEPISIVIPTYTATEYLKICLESIYQNQSNSGNEVIVVVDGTWEQNEQLINSFKDKLNLKTVVFESNRGLAFATNFGFYNASNRLVLNINDDNVCPKDFDKILVETYMGFEAHGPCSPVITPNQIEPRPSIFKPFIIQDFGDTYENFDLKVFTEIEEKYLRKNNIDWDMGWTFPIFLRKSDYLAVGGMDVCYESPHVIDWELFIKLSKSGVRLNRIYGCNFYHFGSKTARTPESYQKEQEAHQYFQYKWGFPAYNRLLQNQG